MLERAALQAGEDRLVDGLGVLGPAQDAAAAGAAQRLVGGERDDVGVAAPGWGATPPAMSPAMWAASNMKQRADLVGDLAERRRVDDARVGGGPGDDQLGPLGSGQVADLVVVDALVARACTP